MKQLVTVPIIIAALMPSAMAVFAADEPVKVFLLVGQSNMEGKGQSGHIDALLADPNTSAEEEARFQHLIKDGKHAVRDDVWIWYLGRTGNLTAGFGNAAEKNGVPFGPELGFGHVVGDHFDGQVLLIKCAWGGKSLRRSFRPPSSPPTKEELEVALAQARKKDPGATKESVKDSYGEYYRETIRLTKDVLANLKTHFPDYDPAQGYALAGMVWFQGWNDLFQGGNAHYGDQLACLIRDIRKDLDAPNLPVVIGESGHGGAITEDRKGTGMDIVRQGQAAPAKMAEFKGTVAFCQTHQFYDPSLEEYVKLYSKCSGNMRRELKKLAKELGKEKIPKKEIPQELKDKVWAPWDAVKADWIKVGSDKGYHFYGSGKIFYLMGDAFGREMVKLQ